MQSCLFVAICRIASDKKIPQSAAYSAYVRNCGMSVTTKEPFFCLFCYTSEVKWKRISLKFSCASARA